MTAPNMAAITASLERSLQSFSLNHQSTISSASASGSSCFGRSSSSTTESHNNGCSLNSTNSSDATLELNSNITLPYHWEQCLDLKTGEVYYINWRTGMKSKEDPRTVDDGFISGYFYSDDDDEEEEEEDEEEESSYGGSGGSSVESSPAASSSRKQKQKRKGNEDEDEDEDEDDENENENENESRIGGGQVLVVAGCKGCFMYFMVPKQVEDCPKCRGQLLHFDRSHE